MNQRNGKEEEGKDSHMIHFIVQYKFFELFFFSRDGASISKLN